MNELSLILLVFCVAIAVGLTMRGNDALKNKTSNESTNSNLHKKYEPGFDDRCPCCGGKIEDPWDFVKWNNYSICRHCHSVITKHRGIACIPQTFSPGVIRGNKFGIYARHDADSELKLKTTYKASQIFGIYNDRMHHIWRIQNRKGAPNCKPSDVHNWSDYDRIIEGLNKNPKNKFHYISSEEVEECLNRHFKLLEEKFVCAHCGKEYISHDLWIKIGQEIDTSKEDDFEKYKKEIEHEKLLHVVTSNVTFLIDKQSGKIKPYCDACVRMTKELDKGDKNEEYKYLNGTVKTIEPLVFFESIEEFEKLL